jgi:nucleoside-diphosphate-sugar epimerase
MIRGSAEDVGINDRFLADSPGLLELDEMKIAVTGVDGRMGSVLRQHWRGSHDLIEIGDDADLRTSGPWQDRITAADTIVHLAAILERADDIDTLKDNIDMTFNVVKAAGDARRLVYASSIWVVHEQTALGCGTYYAAAKRAGEAMVQGWSDVHCRPSVSLRLGLFGVRADPIPVAHEVTRVDQSALCWWFDRAIAFDEPCAAAWLAVGRSGYFER